MLTECVRRMGRKMMVRCIAGYLVIVIGPTLVFSIWAYRSTMQQFQAEFVAQQRLFLSNAASDIETRLLQVAKASESFQYSNALIELIQARTAKDIDIVYRYQETISSLLSDITLRNPSIQSVTLYTGNERISRILQDFQPYTELPEQERDERNSHWIVADSDGLLMLDYYANLYDKPLIHRIARIQLRCTPGMLTSLIDTDSIRAWRLVQGGNVLYDSSHGDERVAKLMADGQGALSATDDTAMVPRKDTVYCTTPINGLDAELQALFAWHPTSGLSTSATQSLFVILLLLCLAVNIMFFATVFSPLKNISRLSNHMHRGELARYEAHHATDEVGELISAYNALVDKTNAMMLTVRNSELLRKNAQIAALQAQIDPHFFYGTLESIRMIAEAARQPLIVDIACSFSQLMRYSLSDKRFVVLREEIDMVRKYIDIQEKRLGKRFECQWVIDESLVETVCPSFVLHPLVENAIVHGAAKTRKPTRIEICIARQAEDVVLTVRDNGPGIEPLRLLEIRRILNEPDALMQLKSSGNGRGIININSRMRLYYGKHYALAIDSEPFVCTTVIIRMQRRDSVDQFTIMGEGD